MKTIISVLWAGHTNRRNLPGRVAQSVACLAKDERLTADRGSQVSYVEIDHEIISTVILLPSTDSFKKVVVSCERKYVHEVLVTHLLKFAKKKCG